MTVNRLSKLHRKSGWGRPMNYLDQQTLDELLDILGEDDLHAITSGFVAQLDAELHDLAQCCNQADLPGVARIAHSLKGGAGNLGANSLSVAAARLERHARMGDSATVGTVMTELPEIVRNTVAELRQGGYTPPALQG